jgi:hypothetical protein
MWRATTIDLIIYRQTLKCYYQQGGGRLIISLAICMDVACHPEAAHHKEFGIVLTTSMLCPQPLLREVQPSNVGNLLELAKPM